MARTGSKLFKLTAFLTFFAVSCLVSILAQAREGFESDTRSLPAPIAKAWKSTFLVFLNEPKIYRTGTAFLVKKEKLGNSTALYFLTNRHVFAGYCAKAGVCREAKLAGNANFIHQSDGLHLQTMEGPIFNNVEVLALSQNPDLALLRVMIWSNTPSIPEPLTISSTCNLSLGEPLFSMGFSDTFYRTYSKRVAIPDQNSIYKRWSIGLFTGYLNSDSNNDEKTNHWASSSVDTLSGGSGGPLLNEAGEVVGVVKNSASRSQNQYRYGGSENPKYLNWQTNAVRCEYLLPFVDKNAN
jgi:S1-C subfamily serine protease